MTKFVPARIALVLALLPAAGVAAAQAPAPGDAKQLQALTACRTIATAAERLACYDSAVAALETAVRDNELVVVDREHIKKTKRSLFGLPLPDINLFGGGAAEGEDVDAIEATIASAWQVEDNMRFQLSDGAVWQQTDGKPWAVTPRNGWPVLIKRGALGSYVMRVNRMAGVKVRRVK